MNQIFTSSFQEKLSQSTRSKKKSNNDFQLSQKTIPFGANKKRVTIDNSRSPTKKKHSGVVKLFPKDRLQQWKRVFEFYKSTQEIIDYTIEQSDPVIYNGYIIYNDNSKFTFQFQLLYLPNLDVVISTYKTDLKCPTCGNKNLTICARCEDKKCAKCNPFCACHSAEDYEKIIFEGDQAKIEQLIPKDLGLMKLTFRESK